ncbi:MAG: hypothetical protein R3242_10645 [Akkermansiaceae bacterium]|nr:hypothetical protein [Akkermansiaceae bacterium]
MSVHSFVAACALLLMVWLSIAFMHSPVMHRGVDSASTEEASAPARPAPQVEELAASVSQ